MSGPGSGFIAVKLPLLPEAACADMPTGLFFPPSGSDGYDAKRICAFCPERDPCLLWALRVREEHGVYGGMTATERERLLSRMPARRGRPPGVIEHAPRSKVSA